MENSTESPFARPATISNVYSPLYVHHADRVKHIAPADYRPNTHLRLLLEQMVEETANWMVAQRKEAIETGTVPAPKH